MIDARPVELDRIHKQRHFGYVGVVVLLIVIQNMLHDVGVVRFLVVLEQAWLLAANVLGEVSARRHILVQLPKEFSALAEKRKNKN